jgi:hypothetical protein
MRKISKSNCVGCQDNYYNYENNSISGECWGLKSAKLVKKLDIPINMSPPYSASKKDLIKRPDCYKRKGYCRVNIESLDSKGYWVR